jgi:hypothetical protein
MELSQPIPVSPSRIGAFLECPKKYDYIYRQELVPLGPTKGFFNKGNYFHELAHVYYQLIQSGAEPGSPHVLAAITRRIQNDSQRTNSLDLLPVYHTVIRAITRYINEHSPRIDKGIEVLGVEEEIELPVTGRFSLFGYLDLRHRTRDRLRIRDHKTGQKAWSKIDVQFSNQLLMYAVIIWALTSEIPVAEINYINTKEYTKPKPYSDMFTFTQVTYSERELQIYFNEICKLIDHMLDSEPTPAYGQHCRYCPYQTICYASRKGIDVTPLVESNFKKVPRTKRHDSFTQDNAPIDEGN